MESDLIERIYEASFTPALWSDVLLDIAALSGSKGGLLLSTRGKALNWTASDDIYDAFADYLQGGWFQRCGRRVCLLEKAHSAFLTELDYWTEDELQKNDIYQDFFYPRNLGWSAGTGLIMPTGDHIVVSVERERDRGPIENRDVELLNAMRPHIARAAMVAARMGLRSATSAKDAFEKLSIPTLLLDMNGAGIDCSGEVEAMSDIVTWGAGDRVVLKDNQAQAMLQDALAALGENDRVQSFAVKQEGGRAAYVAHVVPVSRSAHDIFAKGYALLVLNPINKKARPSTDLLHSLFDLTAAEARVARELGAGVGAEDIAENAGVSINTVRTQIRKILEKTGAARLPELVSLIAHVSRPQ